MSRDRAGYLVITYPVWFFCALMVVVKALGAPGIRELHWSLVLAPFWVAAGYAVSHNASVRYARPIFKRLYWISLVVVGAALILAFLGPLSEIDAWVLTALSWGETILMKADEIFSDLGDGYYRPTLRAYVVAALPEVMHWLDLRPFANAHWSWRVATLVFFWSAAANNNTVAEYGSRFRMPMRIFSLLSCALLVAFILLYGVAGRHAVYALTPMVGFTLYGWFVARPGVRDLRRMVAARNKLIEDGVPATAEPRDVRDDLEQQIDPRPIALPFSADGSPNLNLGALAIAPLLGVVSSGVLGYLYGWTFYFAYWVGNETFRLIGYVIALLFAYLALTVPIPLAAWPVVIVLKRFRCLHRPTLQLTAVGCGVAFVAAVMMSATKHLILETRLTSVSWGALGLAVPLVITVYGFAGWFGLVAAFTPARDS